MLNKKVYFSFNKKTVAILIALFLAAFTIYWVTGEGHATYYNYYVRLADAFLHGRLYLLENPSWLNELIPNPSGIGYYVVYPPFPAVLMAPLVAIFGLDLNQTLFGLFFAAATIPMAYLVAKDVIRKKKIDTKVSRKVYVWFAVLFGFGTLFWYLASLGSVWLIAQVISAFFLFWALHEFFNKNRPLLVGLLVGASFWCRLPTALAIFFFALLAVWQQNPVDIKGKIKSSLPYLGKLAVGMGFFVLLNFIYNYVRFGSIFDVGYWMIPGILDEPWFSKGFFSFYYITDNLVPFLTGLPIVTSTAPYLQFPMTGLAIWVTTPAFIFALKSKLKDATTISAWIATISIALIIFTKGLSGWGFGYRYAMDFYPLLFLLTVQGMGSNLRWYHKLLIIAGIVVNAWGVIAINKFPGVSVLV
jgi:hypothetical protein